MTLQPPVVAHRGEGITDPDLQATFDDPVHLTIPRESWEEMQRQEEERKSRRSTPSDSSPSSKVEPPKKKHSKKQKKMPEDGDLASSDDSSSSTIVEKTGEGSTPSTIRRGAAPPLHTARKMADMEQRLEQLQAVVTGLSATIANVMDGQLGLESANNALAASNQDFRTQVATQRARIDKLERTTRELHNQLGDVEAQVDNNVKRLTAVLETVNNLQDSHEEQDGGLC
jgi:chromosome segregation ATPase